MKRSISANEASKKIQFTLRKKKMHFLSKRFVNALAFGVFVTASLVGCGGGGSSASSAPAPSTPIVQTYNLVPAWAAYWAGTDTLSASVVAVINGQTGTASYTETRGALTAATFEGQTAFRKTVLGVITPITPAGSSESVSDDQYFDTNYNFVGSSGVSTGYVVVTNHPVIPTALKVGDSGVWYSVTGYTSSSKTGTSQLGTSSYSVQADSADSVLFVVTEVATGKAGSKVTTYRLTQAGVLKKLKVQVTNASLSTTLTFN